MTFDDIIIRYGELSLKGKNRNMFIENLQSHIQQKLQTFPDVKLERAFDRMVVHLHGQPYMPVIRTLQHVFGIQTLSVALRVRTELEEIKKGTLAATKEIEGVETFKVSSKRIDKQFSISSQELNPLLGRYVLENTNQLHVDVHHPDMDLRIEVHHKETFISGIEFAGAGGLPVGVSGKVMLMLSGGIDSPVAGYFALKRGAQIEAVHFHSPPYTSERAKQKVIDICQQLSAFAGNIRLHVVPFTKVQEAINQHIPDSYRMTIMRRMMLRIMDKLAVEHEALAIANGENLGQVASQTLESMNTIGGVTSLPILRPVLSMDKNDIVERAKNIGTYDISIRPYEDCCTLFVPAAPKNETRSQSCSKV